MKEYDDNTVIVLDTNIFNHVFTHKIKVGKAILALLTKYKKNIWIPYTVLYELRQIDFEMLKNQRKSSYKKFLSQISNEYEGFINKINKLKNEADNNGFFSWGDYLVGLLDKIKEEQKNESKILQEIKEKRAQEYSDRLAELIDELNELLEELSHNKQVGKDFSVQEKIEICREGKVRFEAEIPPGYSDEGKKEGYSKYNDLFVWKEIIKMASSYEKTNIVFLTDDLKEGNWWINSKDESKRKMSPLLMQEFYESCPGSYEDKLGVNITFHTLSDFMRESNYYDFSLLQMEKDEILSKIKQMYTTNIQEELYDFVWNLEMSDICDFFCYPNNAGEIMYEDLIFESENIEEGEEGFCCRMTVSQEYECYVNYEDNEGDTMFDE